MYVDARERCKRGVVVGAATSVLLRSIHFESIAWPITAEIYAEDEPSQTTGLTLQMEYKAKIMKLSNTL